MIAYSLYCMIASALLVASPFVAIEVSAALAVNAKKRKERKETLAQQKQDKLTQRELDRILKEMQCKWDEKVECRQGRSCDYCAMINCLREE